MTLGEIGAGLRANMVAISRAVQGGARLFVRRVYTETIRSSREAARLVRNCIRRPRGCNLISPTLVISGRDMQETARHVQAAQLGGGSAVQLAPAPFLLHYQNKPDRLRERALRPYKAPGQECFGSNPLKWCDEYPFFKSREGAPRNLPGRVSLRLVPSTEQVRQGGLFLGMKVACGMQERPIKKSRFLVVPLPESDLPSAFVCLR